MAKSNSQLALFKRGEWDRLKTLEIAPLFPIFVVYHAVREFFRDRVPDLTSNLAFTSALAIVPLLSIVVSTLALVGAFGGDAGSIAPYLQQFFPAAASNIASYLNGFAETSAQSTAGVGAIALFVIGVFLFQSIERAFNIIWMSSKSWSLGNVLFAFPAVILLGPTFLGFSFLQTANAQIRLEQMGLDTSFIDVVLPFVVSFLVFSALNYFLPRPKVQWYSALVGGLFTAIGFELAKWGFNLYITEVIFEPYNKIYGTLGLFPIFLIWLYVLWTVILLGVELAYCTQNLRTLMTIQAAAKRDPLRGQDRIFSPFVGLELYTPIARAFKSGDRPMTEKGLVESTGYSSTVIRDVVEKLEENASINVVQDEASGESKLIPSKQLDDIQLLPLVESFYDFSAHANSLPLKDLFDGFHAVVLEALRGKSALELVPENTELGEKYAKPAYAPLPASGLSEVPERPLADGMPDAPPVYSTGETASKVVLHDMTDDSSFTHLPDKLAPKPLTSERPSGLSYEKETYRRVEEKTVEESGIHVGSGDFIIDELGTEKDAGESVEIEVSADWDTYEIGESLSDLDLGKMDDLRRTSEIDIEEEMLGNEKSVPPPVPDKT